MGRMANPLSPGSAVTIVKRSTPPEQWSATVVVSREDSIAARAASPPAAWDPGHSYMISFGPQGARLYAICSFVASKDEIAAFRLTTPWRQLDRRAHRRHTIDLPLEVRSVLGSSRQSGRLIDISLGGLAVRVETRPGGSQLEVNLWNGGYAATVPCELVRAEEGPQGGHILHLRFRDLSAPQNAFVRQFIASLASVEEAS